MKKIALVSLMLLASQSFAAEQVTDKSPERVQVGYSFGYLMGRSNTNALDDLDLDSFLEGFKQGFEGKDSSLSNEQMISILNQYKKKSEAAELVEFQKTAEQNLAQGQAFLADNAKKSGIKVTNSGLQYQVIKQGSGKKPSATSKVLVHYEGRLIDGTVFDSSIARDQPISFPLNKVIAGWQEGLQLMQEGDQYRLFIPAKLAYGETGAGASIPPNSALIFDVQLLKVES